MDKQVDKQLLGVKDVAEALHIGETLAKTLIRTKRIKSVKIGARRLIAPEDLQAYVKELREQAAAEDAEGPPRLPARYWSEFREEHRRYA